MLFALSCSASKEAKKSEQIKATDSISLERTACYGTCPVYTLTIYADGKVAYKGENHIEQIGLYSGQLEKQATIALFAKISSYSWQLYPEKYPIDNYDFPQFHLEYKSNDMTKLVKGNTNAAQELIALAKQMDKLVGGITLKKD